MIHLIRYAYCRDHTLGHLHVDDWSCFTIERPWQGNRRNVSCIPEGVYPIHHTQRHNGAQAIAIDDVPDRSAILIHSANWVHELKGCVAPGIGLGVMDNMQAVLGSVSALYQILERIADPAVHATLRVAWGDTYGPRVGRVEG